MATKTNKKTMDVAKPGKTAPDASARPVIVSHRPTVQDPMVKSDKPAGEAQEPETISTSHKVIQPLTEEGAIKSDSSSDKPAAEKDAADTSSGPSGKTETPAETTVAPAEEAAVVDAVIDQAAADKKKEADISQAEQKKQEEIAKLIAEKKYFVPIGQVAKRRNKRAGVVVLVLLLLVVGTYLAIDAGLLDIGVQLPLELIQN